MWHVDEIYWDETLENKVEQKGSFDLSYCGEDDFRSQLGNWVQDVAPIFVDRQHNFLIQLYKM